MTETQWLGSGDPESMLLFLRGRASGRKLRLFAVACCRRVGHLLVDESSREALRMAEHHADGLVAEKDLSGALSRNRAFIRGAPPHSVERRAAAAVNAAAGGSPWAAAWNVVSEVRTALNRSADGLAPGEAREQADLLRHVVGNPFRTPTLAPGWLYGNGGSVLKLAHSIYNDGSFNRMPILADALEEAGCADAAVLEHCRHPGAHMRGCWALDLLLRKG
jgi:hypothetical protein